MESLSIKSLIWNEYFLSLSVTLELLQEDVPLTGVVVRELDWTLWGTEEREGRAGYYSNNLMNTGLENVFWKIFQYTF